MPALHVSEDELRELLITRLAIVDETEFARAQAMARRLRLPLERAIIERGRIPLGFLLEQVAAVWGVGFIDLNVSDVTADALGLVAEEYARRHALVPIAVSGRDLRVAMWDPRDREVIDTLERKTRLKVVPLLAPDIAIARAHLLYRGDLRLMLERSLAEDTLRISARDKGAEERSTVDVLNRILEYAAVSRASDIHIEPYEFEVLVRCRVDGVLHEILSLPASALSSLVARVKVLSGMRIDERRAPQDGRFEADLGGLKLDLRSSTLPTHWGEKVVLRVLAKENVQPDLEDLGFSASGYEIVLRNVFRPFGMVLVTGPTGSGKSSSLYAMLLRIGAERQNVVNISTIEDPVEYTFPRINQTAVNAAAGVEFSTGLRALLRQDPDVIMVGEIRDRETVEIAVRAALVGRLLLSTLHTNDATGAVPRLLDMGVEPFLIASTLNLVVGQRLVRRICVDCRESVVADSAVLEVLRRRPDFEQTIAVLQKDGALGQEKDPLAGISVFRGKGCPQCGGRGFRGRIGIFEVFEIDDRIRTMIMERRDGPAIREAAIAGGMKTMFQDGLAKVFLGETSIEEVFRVAL